MTVSGEEPNLFIVGFQKCGSSSLFDFLATHPLISGASPKETYFLCDRDYELFDPDQNISSKNASWTPYFSGKTARYRMEASVCNFYQKIAMDYISGINDSKVIFIVRDPVERFVSTYKYNLNWLLKYHGDVTIEKYYELIKRNELNRDMCRYAIEHGKYLKYINLWHERLRKDQILIVNFHDFIKNQDVVVKQLCEFLAVKNEFSKTIPKSNTTTSPRFRSLHKFILRFFGGRNFPGKEFILKLYQSFFQKKDLTKISPELHKLLSKEYQDEYEQLFKVTKLI